MALTLTEANSWLALIGMLVLTGVVARMDSRTCNGIRVGVTLMFAGLGSDFLSIWLHGWGAWGTSLMYLGGAVFFLADKRHRARTDWTPHREGSGIDFSKTYLGR